MAKVFPEEPLVEMDARSGLVRKGPSRSVARDIPGALRRSSKEWDIGLQACSTWGLPGLGGRI